MEQMDTVMEVFVHNFCAHTDTSSDGNVLMKKATLQKLLVTHLLPYVAGDNDPEEVLRIMRDLSEDHGGSVDFQSFMSTWARVVVAGHSQFKEHVFVKKGPCSPLLAELVK